MRFDALVTLYESLPEEITFLLSVAALFISLAVCFFGYKLTKTAAAIGSFGAGLVLTHALLPVFANSVDKPLPDAVVTIISLGVALALSMLAYKFYRFGIFLFGFVLCWMLLSGLTMKLYLALAICAVFGAFCLLVMRTLLVFVFALGGGMSAGYIIVSFVPALDAYPNIYLIVGLLLSLAGMMAQFKIPKRQKNEN